jgi:hypothetical protein
MVIKGEQFSYIPVDSAVPQESVLRPSLFLH